MLVEIFSDKLSVEKITFHQGLNVVRGDDEGRNSIGKSSMLMIIDFVFGGNSLFDSYQSTIQQLGHHSYYFAFQFAEGKYRFRRDTHNKNYVFKCGDDYTEINSIKLNDFHSFLNHKYGGDAFQLSFRDMVGPFSRIWGKDNSTNINYPLHGAKQEREREAIKRLIKLFGRYNEISNLEYEYTEKDKEKKALSSAIAYEYFPKLTKDDYKENRKRLEKINNNIKEIKQSISNKSFNFSKIVNDEILELNDEKSKLLNYKLNLENKVFRVKSNLEKGKYIKSKSFKDLLEYFPNINTDKINEVEKFHKGLQEILSKELKSKERELNSRIKDVDHKIDELDENIKKLTEGDDDSDTHFIDRLIELASEKKKIEKENYIYDRTEAVYNEVKRKKNELLETKQEISDSICDGINSELRNLTDVIYSPDREPPTISIYNNSYNFETVEDKGTGKAYSNLILFDLSIFLLTSLPIVIHDSLLFKNIENEAIENIIKIYRKQTKQIFVSIDEVSKYKSDAQHIIDSHSVIELDNNNLLFTKDWR